MCTFVRAHQQITFAGLSMRASTCRDDGVLEVDKAGHESLNRMDIMYRMYVYCNVALVLVATNVPAIQFRDGRKYWLRELGKTGTVTHTLMADIVAAFEGA